MPALIVSESIQLAGLCLPCLSSRLELSIASLRACFLKFRRWSFSSIFFWAHCQIAQAAVPRKIPPPTPIIVLMTSFIACSPLKEFPAVPAIMNPDPRSIRLSIFTRITRAFPLLCDVLCQIVYRNNVIVIFKTFHTHVTDAHYAWLLRTLR